MTFIWTEHKKASVCCTNFLSMGQQHLGIGTHFDSTHKNIMHATKLGYWDCLRECIDFIVRDLFASLTLSCVRVCVCEYSGSIYFIHYEATDEKLHEENWIIDMGWLI